MTKMNAEDIDVEVLISLVQERPILWDRENAFFKDKLSRAKEWASICRILFSEYDDFDEIEKNEIVNELLKKWRGVKDNFFKYVKKSNEIRASGSKKIKKYHYYDKLLFLSKLLENKNDIGNETENSTKTEKPTIAPDPSRHVPVNRKRRHQTTQTSMDEEDNRHLSFFKGILPSIENFSEFQTLTFQSRVIQLITEMRFGQLPQLTISQIPSQLNKQERLSP